MRTHSMKTGLQNEIFTIEANYVILAAGSLGSTEILKRSADYDDPGFSATLGSRFSTNGDGLGMSVGQKGPVNAIGTELIGRDKDENPGPTITGIVQGKIKYDGHHEIVTIEDGAVPGSLVKIFGELAGLLDALVERAQRIGRDDPDV